MSTSYTIRRYLAAPEPQDVVFYNTDAIKPPSIASFGSDVPSTVSPSSSVSAHSRRSPNLNRKQGHRPSENHQHHVHLRPSSSRHRDDTISHQNKPRRVYGSVSGKSLILVAPSVTSSKSGAGLSIASRSTVKSSASISSSSSSVSSSASDSTIKPSSHLTITPTTSRSRTSSISSCTSSHTSSSSSTTTTTTTNNHNHQLVPNSILLKLPHDEARLAAYLTYFIRVKNIDPAAATAYLATRRDCTAAACHLKIMAAADDGGARLELFVEELLRKHGAVCRRVIWRGHRGDEELEHWLDDLRADRENWPRARERERE